MAGAARSIAAWLIRHDAIKEEDRSLYEYAVHSLILTLAPLLMVISIGCVMGLIKESIIFILPFMVIRKYSGGFHMKHAWTCFICSCATLLLCIYVTSKIHCSVTLNIMVLGAAVSLGICSPIDSDNRKLDADEKQKYKRTTILIAAVFLIIYGLLLLLQWEYYARWIAVGLILPAVLQMPVVARRGWVIFTKAR